MFSGISKSALPGILGLAICFLGCGACLAAPRTIVVAASGEGDYKTIQEAVAAVTDNNSDRTVIRIGAGTYEGPVVVPKTKINVTFEGAASGKSVLTYDKNVRDPRPAGAHIFNPCLDVIGDDFHIDNMTIQNTSGDHGQALAVRVNADRLVFAKCRLLGWQDTILLDKGRYYFKDCYIEGRVDFIYGEGNSLFENCEIHSKNGGFVTAADTKPETPFGFVFLKCKLTGDPAPWVDSTGKIPTQMSDHPMAYLGRPWRPYGSVTFLDCQMGDHIQPAGWDNWGNAANEKTARYAEYGSTTLDGKPLDLSKRAPWAKRLTREEAAQLTSSRILGGWDPR